jgi:hypothetical protein
MRPAHLSTGTLLRRDPKSQGTEQFPMTTPPLVTGEPTLASVWYALAASTINDNLLDWPPDLFALTNIILSRSEGFRFALSPLGEWPPDSGWARRVADTAREWSGWIEARDDAIPNLLADEWRAFRDRADHPLEELAQGRDSRLCQALLTLHAIADEACAGLGVALDTYDANGGLYRARGRELLARTGSLSRIDTRHLRVLPKVRTPPTGRASFARYACVQGPGIEARWHKMPARHRGADPQSEYATLLLLPWPLRVRSSDFRSLDHSVQRLSKEPYGFFEFAPAEGLDFDLLDRVLTAAREEARSIDVVIMPESAVDEGELDGLEALLHHHGVIWLQTGVRQRATNRGSLPGNWIHIGINPQLEKGGPQPGSDGQSWFHIRQNKHHRWALDANQVYQYHLGGALHPDIQWWEAMEVPRRAVEFVEVAELTLVSLVCEDLAHRDEIADLIQAVGPTVVMTALLDGPQLTSRWAARYASVLADDPGSAVLTLTSYGMVQRSRPHGHGPSPVVALWKDPARGMREIPLEPGAHGVLLTVRMARAIRRSADGRMPVDNGMHAFDVAVQQVTAAAAPPRSLDIRQGKPTAPLAESEVTILTGWAEAVAEAAAYDPERIAAVLADAHGHNGWRTALGLPEPSRRLREAFELLERRADAVGPLGDESRLDQLLATSSEARPDEPERERLVRRVLLATLEERHTRQAAR